MRTLPTLPLGLLLVSALAGADPLVFDGQAPDDDSRYFTLSFTVPDGTAEVEVRHRNLDSANVLDWGLEDPNGFRGWGGGNAENAVVGVDAASRSYLPGAIPAGTWKVVVGKAKVVVKPARYHIEVLLRDTATLAPQPERRPYQPAAALQPGRRWYAGDFHVHSRESGDALPPLDELATFARSRGMDFIHLSDHNTTSHLSLIGDAQARHPELLLVPGVEFTTYRGHANGIGATLPVDSRIGFGGQTLQAAVESFRSQGALFSINHPVLDIGDLCIGCAWQHPLPAGGVDAVEIGTGGWEEGGVLFSEAAIAFWDWVCAQGIHAAAIGGSDDHRAGHEATRLQSPIGSPTTLVLADGLSVPALLDAVRSGRTVVKLHGPEDPMVELTATGERRGDTVAGEGTHLVAKVTGGQGARVRLVKNGAALPAVNVTADPFELPLDAVSPDQGEDRWRAEVLVQDRPRTVTSHVWLARAFGQSGPGVQPGFSDTGCGCGAAPWTSGALLAGLLAGLWGRRRQRRSPRPA